MKKKATGSRSKASGKLAARDFGALIAEVRDLIQSARHAAATTVNTLQVLTNFEIGRRIVEHEQRGAARAEYGKELLKELSARLTEEFGKGFSATNLKLMRQFFIESRHRIGQKASDQLATSEKISWKSGNPFALSWSHYVLLLTIKNPEERAFYEVEARQSGWSLPELKRQLASSLYERLALSRDNEERSQARGRGTGIDSARGHAQRAVCPRVPRPG